MPEPTPKFRVTDGSPAASFLKGWGTDPPSRRSSRGKTTRLVIVLLPKDATGHRAQIIP